MKFIKGEKVKFLNNVGGGVVVKVLSNNMVEVRTDDGFEYPILVDELISIDEDITNRQYGFKTETDKHREKVKMPKKEVFVTFDDDEDDDDFDEVIYPLPQQIVEKEEINPSNDINLFFAFVPTDTNIEKADFMAYIVNDSNYSIMYNVYNNLATEFWNKQGIISANSKELLDTFKHTAINELEDFTFQLLVYKKTKHDKKTAIQKDIKLNAKNFFVPKKFTENDFFYEDSMIISLINEDGMREAIENLVKKDIEKALSEKLKAQNAEKNSNYIKNIQPKNQEKIIDLHIHELIEDESGLSRNDILDIQMKKFNSELEDAIKKHLGRIVFIHGVGNGRLKLEILNTLKKPKYKKLSYQDASFKEYGYGATLIII